VEADPSLASRRPGEHRPLSQHPACSSLVRTPRHTLAYDCQGSQADQYATLSRPPRKARFARR
jgi:hypothetical protein